MDNKKLFEIMYNLKKSLDSFVFSVEKKLNRRFGVETDYLRRLRSRKKQKEKEKKQANKKHG